MLKLPTLLILVGLFPAGSLDEVVAPEAGDSIVAPIKQGDKHCWTPWLNRDSPGGTGDWETISLLKKKYPKTMCPNPMDIEVRTKYGKTPEQTATKFTRNLKVGFICRNKLQKKKKCQDYVVRFSCPTKYCFRGKWTDWLDRDNQSGKGDYETLPLLRKKYPDKNICEKPILIEALTKSGKPASKSGRVFAKYNPTEGLLCLNKENAKKKCLDYKVRFFCYYLDNKNEKGWPIL